MFAYHKEIGDYLRRCHVVPHRQSTCPAGPKEGEHHILKFSPISLLAVNIPTLDFTVDRRCELLFSNQVLIVELIPSNSCVTCTCFCDEVWRAKMIAGIHSTCVFVDVQNLSTNSAAIGSHCMETSDQSMSMQ